MGRLIFFSSIRKKVQRNPLIFAAFVFNPLRSVCSFGFDLFGYCSGSFHLRTFIMGLRLALVGIRWFLGTAFNPVVSGWVLVVSGFCGAMGAIG